MAHITLPEGLPGIIGPLAFRPETARPLAALADALLAGPSTLERAERELIGTYVSYLNECKFCHNSHGALAQYLLKDTPGVADAVRRDYRSAPISQKLKALLNIAGKVQRDGRLVTEEDVAAARSEGATDIEIHDTVLIAAAFCMFNRYVDGLSTFTPSDPDGYRERARFVARHGYAAVATPRTEEPQA
jgi:uncharacterized peroxidase-related enzyme